MKKIFYGLTIVGFLLLPAFGRAEGLPRILISEINWAGSSLSTADEWIELYNADGKSVDLGGWILTGLATSRGALTIASGTVIPPATSLLIANYELGNEKTTLNVAPTLVTSSISIPNTDLDTYLAMPDGTVVDEVHDTGTPDYGSSTMFASMERNLETLAWQTSITSTNLLDTTQLGTPAAVTAVPVVEIPKTVETPTNPIIEEEPVVINPAIDDVGADPSVRPLETPGEDIVPEEITETIPIDELVVRVGSPDPVVETPIEPIIEDSTIDDVGTGRDLSIPEEEIIESSESIIDPIIETIPSDPVVADAVIDDEPIVDDSNVGTTLGLSEPEEPQNEITPTVTEPIVDELIVETPIETIVDELDVRVGSPDPVIETVIAPTVLPGDIIITEICSNPNEDNEWVEIKNVSATAINLLNWNIQDASGKNVLFPEVSLESSSVFVLENIKMLNNDGDAVTLMDSTGQTIDSMAYGTEQISAPKKGESIARFANSWSVSINPTPGAENVAVADEVTTTTETYEEQTPNQVQTIESTASQVAPASSNGSSTHAGTASVVSDPASTVHKIVAVAEPAKTAATKSTTTKSTSSSSKTSSLESRTGVVTALPGTFGDQIAYIDGIQLYFYTKDWPTLHLGDEIRVLGTLSESYGEARLKISTKDNITILSQTTLTPRVLSIAEAKTQNTGALVQITGEITERTGNNLVVQFGEDAITVVAHEKTGIAWTDFTGTAITVTGIVRQINGEAKLYPRSVNDVRIEEIKTISATSSVLSFQEFTPWIGGALVLGVSSFLAYWYIRSKQISILNTSTT